MTSTAGDDEPSLGWTADGALLGTDDAEADLGTYDRITNQEHAAVSPRGGWHGGQEDGVTIPAKIEAARGRHAAAEKARRNSLQFPDGRVYDATTGERVTTTPPPPAAGVRVELAGGYGESSLVLTAPDGTRRRLRA